MSVPPRLEKTLKRDRAAMHRSDETQPVAQETGDQQEEKNDDYDEIVNQSVVVRMPDSKRARHASVAPSTEEVTQITLLENKIRESGIPGKCIEWIRLALGQSKDWMNKGGSGFKLAWSFRALYQMNNALSTGLVESAHAALDCWEKLMDDQFNLEPSHANGWPDVRPFGELRDWVRCFLTNEAHTKDLSRVEWWQLIREARASLMRYVKGPVLDLLRQPWLQHGFLCHILFQTGKTNKKTLTLDDAGVPSKGQLTGQGRSLLWSYGDCFNTSMCVSWIVCVSDLLLMRFADHSNRDRQQSIDDSNSLSPSQSLLQSVPELWPQKDETVESFIEEMEELGMSEWLEGLSVGELISIFILGCRGAWLYCLNGWLTSGVGGSAMREILLQWWKDPRQQSNFCDFWIGVIWRSVHSTDLLGATLKHTFDNKPMWPAEINLNTANKLERAMFPLGWGLRDHQKSYYFGFKREVLFFLPSEAYFKSRFVFDAHMHSNLSRGNILAAVNFCRKSERLTMIRENFAVPDLTWKFKMMYPSWLRVNYNLDVSHLYLPSEWPTQVIDESRMSEIQASIVDLGESVILQDANLRRRYGSPIIKRWMDKLQSDDCGSLECDMRRMMECIFCTDFRSQSIESLVTPEPLTPSRRGRKKTGAGGESVGSDSIRRRRDVATISNVPRKTRLQFGVESPSKLDRYSRWSAAREKERLRRYGDLLFSEVDSLQSLNASSVDHLNALNQADRRGRITESVAQSALNVLKLALLEVPDSDFEKEWFRCWISTHSHLRNVRNRKMLWDGMIRLYWQRFCFPQSVNGAVMPVNLRSEPVIDVFLNNHPVVCLKSDPTAVDYSALRSFTMLQLMMNKHFDMESQVSSLLFENWPLELYSASLVGSKWPGRLEIIKAIFHRFQECRDSVHRWNSSMLLVFLGDWFSKLTHLLAGILGDGVLYEGSRVACKGTGATLLSDSSVTHLIRRLVNDKEHPMHRWIQSVHASEETINDYAAQFLEYLHNSNLHFRELLLQCSLLKSADGVSVDQLLHLWCLYLGQLRAASKMYLRSVRTERVPMRLERFDFEMEILARRAVLTCDPKWISKIARVASVLRMGPCLFQCLSNCWNTPPYTFSTLDKVQNRRILGRVVSGVPGQCVSHPASRLYEEAVNERKPVKTVRFLVNPVASDAHFLIGVARLSRKPQIETFDNRWLKYLNREWLGRVVPSLTLGDGQIAGDFDEALLNQWIRQGMVAVIRNPFREKYLGNYGGFVYRRSCFQWGRDWVIVLLHSQARVNFEPQLNLQQCCQSLCDLAEFWELPLRFNIDGGDVDNDDGMHSKLAVDPEVLLNPVFNDDTEGHIMYLIKSWIRIVSAHSRTAYPMCNESRRPSAFPVFHHRYLTNTRTKVNKALIPPDLVKWFCDPNREALVPTDERMQYVGLNDSFFWNVCNADEGQLEEGDEGFDDISPIWKWKSERLIRLSHPVKYVQIQLSHWLEKGKFVCGMPDAEPKALEDQLVSIEQKADTMSGFEMTDLELEVEAVNQSQPENEAFLLPEQSLIYYAPHKHDESEQELEELRERPNDSEMERESGVRPFSAALARRICRGHLTTKVPKLGAKDIWLPSVPGISERLVFVEENPMGIALGESERMMGSRIQCFESSLSPNMKDWWPAVGCGKSVSALSPPDISRSFRRGYEIFSTAVETMSDLEDKECKWGFSQRVLVPEWKKTFGERVTVKELMKFSREECLKTRCRPWINRRFKYSQSHLSAILRSVPVYDSKVGWFKVVKRNLEFPECEWVTDTNSCDMSLTGMTKYIWKHGRSHLCSLLRAQGPPQEIIVTPEMMKKQVIGDYACILGLYLKHHVSVPHELISVFGTMIQPVDVRTGQVEGKKLPLSVSVNELRRIRNRDIRPCQPSKPVDIRVCQSRDLESQMILKMRSCFSEIIKEAKLMKTAESAAHLKRVRTFTVDQEDRDEQEKALLMRLLKKHGLPNHSHGLETNSKMEDDCEDVMMQ